jgi:replicative DNA helicase
MNQPFKNKTSKYEQMVAQYGKVPPQCSEVEEAILGSFMLESESYLLNPVNPEIFYKEEHQKICAIIQEMSKAGKKIDLLTVTSKLREKELLDFVGGPLFITQLTSRVASVAHLDHHILILRDKYLRREMIRMSSQLQSEAYDENIDLADIIESAQEIFMKLLSDETENVKTFSEVAIEISDTMAQNTQDQKESTGILIGYKKFDEFTYGVQPGDLVIIAGESSHGKTMLLTNILNFIAKSGYPVNIHSLEMSSKQLVARILSIESGIPAKDMLFQKLYKEQIVQIENHITKLDGLPIYFDDKSTASAIKICASIRKMVLKFGVKVAAIDYLQLVTGDNGAGREEEIGQNARMFKNLAKELNIVVFLLSQFSNSESHVPNIGRLRGSGQIKEAADFVIMVWIPEKEGILFVKREDNTEDDMRGKAGVIVGKGRNTGTLNFNIECYKDINKMCDPKTYSSETISNSHIQPNVNFSEPGSSNW